MSNAFPDTPPHPLIFPTPRYAIYRRDTFLAYEPLTELRTIVPSGFSVRTEDVWGQQSTPTACEPPPLALDSGLDASNEGETQDPEGAGEILGCTTA